MPDCMLGVVSALDALAGVADRAVLHKRPRAACARLRYLRDRELGGDPRTGAQLRSWIEGETLRKLDTGEYIELDKNAQLVRSTISIAFSHDGKFFASTHGDHSVKVFEYPSRRQIACLDGHPRTPWTVRFHPTDSSVVASGCLGNECRVWNVALNRCVRKHIFAGSISCVSFSPSGEFLAVTSGKSLFLWNFAQPTEDGSFATRTADPPPAFTDGTPPADAKGMPVELLGGNKPFHMVDFHPSGHMLMTGEKNRTQPCEERDADAAQEEQFTLKLVVHRFDRRMGVKFAPPVLIVPRVVAYNDAGIHFSPCGKMLAACVPLSEQSKDFHIAVMNLKETERCAIGDVLYSANLGKGHVAALTNLKFSSTSTHLLAGFSFRPQNPVLRTHAENFDANALGLAGDGSRDPGLAPCGAPLQSPHPQIRVVDIYRVDKLLRRIRSLGADVDINEQNVGGAEDEINVAVFAPRAGIADGIIYGTQKGRIRVFQQASGRKYYPAGVCDDNCKIPKFSLQYIMQPMPATAVSVAGRTAVWTRYANAASSSGEPPHPMTPDPPPHPPLPRITHEPPLALAEPPSPVPQPGAIGVFLESSYRRSWPAAGAARPNRRPPAMSLQAWRRRSAAIRMRDPMPLPPPFLNRPPQGSRE